jgi:hypothetical protein
MMNFCKKNILRTFMLELGLALFLLKLNKKIKHVSCEYKLTSFRQYYLFFWLFYSLKTLQIEKTQLQIKKTRFCL